MNMNQTIMRTAATVLCGLGLAAAAGDTGAMDVAKSLKFRAGTRVQVAEQEQAYVWNQKIEIENSGAEALKLVDLAYTVELKDRKTGKVRQFGVGEKAEVQITAPKDGETVSVTGTDFGICLGSTADPASIRRLLDVINGFGDPEARPDVVLKGQATVWMGINHQAGCWVEGPVVRFELTVTPDLPREVAMAK